MGPTVKRAPAFDGVMKSLSVLLVLTLAVAPLAPAASAFGIPVLDNLLGVLWAPCGYEGVWLWYVPVGVSGADTYTDAKGKRHVVLTGPSRDINLRNECVGPAKVMTVKLGASDTYRWDMCPGCSYSLLP